MFNHSEFLIGLCIAHTCLNEIESGLKLNARGAFNGDSFGRHVEKELVRFDAALLTIAVELSVLAEVADKGPHGFAATRNEADSANAQNSTDAPKP